MPAATVLHRGLALMRGSPFSKSLPQEFHTHIDELDVESAVGQAQSSPLFSDVTQYLQRKNRVHDAYYNEVSSRTLKHSHLLSESLQADLAQDQDSSHLKIKTLAEFALSQLNGDHRLLSLDEVHVLKRQISDLEALKLEIRTQLQNNSNIMQNTMRSKNSVYVEDISIIQTVLSSSDGLVERLMSVVEEVEEKSSQLNTQYILALSLCYFEDLNISTESAQNPIQDRQADELLSHIASAAVQRNIALPPPQSEGKSQWAKECLDVLLNSQSEVASTKDIPANVGVNEEETLKVKTALKDLQFAHQYLTRQYEEERSLNSNIMNSHKTKKLALENKLSESIISLEKSNQRAILIEHEKNILEVKLNDKSKEVNDLQKQVALLKIDQLGSNSESVNLSPSDKENLYSPSSPITGLSVSLDKNERAKYLSNPKTPLMQQNVNNYRFSSPTSPKYNSSISVLKKEFKKMIQDLHTSYESQLQKEQTERKRLENLLKLYEERDDQESYN